MKPSRQFGPLPHVRYRPELTACPHCGAPLAYRHPVWAKPVQFLGGVEHVTSLGFGCSNPACPFPKAVYRSARAEARQIKGSGYGLDVVVRIGHQRFSAHRTREEIWRALRDASVAISERHVQNLIEVYLALLRASQHDSTDRLRGIVEEHGGIILALDGLQPEQGNEQLWIVREVFSGTVLGAANLQQASAPVLAALLEPLQALKLPVLGVISDAQESIHLAVAAVFPGVPHQFCQYHVLREAAEPLWEADRHLLVQAKKELRGFRAVEERTRRAETRGAPAEEQATSSAQAVVADGDDKDRRTVRLEPPSDSAEAVVLDTVLALRQTVRERGVLPLDFAGVRVMESLDALGTTLDRCLAKRGMPGSPGCGP